MGAVQCQPVWGGGDNEFRQWKAGAGASFSSVQVDSGAGEEDRRRLLLRPVPGDDGSDRILLKSKTSLLSRQIANWITAEPLGDIVTTFTVFFLPSFLPSFRKSVRQLTELLVAPSFSLLPGNEVM